MCSIIFSPNSSVVRIIHYIWKWHILHIFSLVCNVSPSLNILTVIPKWSTEMSFHENHNLSLKLLVQKIVHEPFLSITGIIALV